MLHLFSPRTARIRFRQAARILLYSALLPLLGFWLLWVAVGEWIWPLDTLGQFQFQISLCFLSLAFAFHAADFRTGMHAASIVFICIALDMLPLYHRPPEPVCTAGCVRDSLTVVQYNIYYENRNTEGVIKWAKNASDVDILILHEIPQEWQKPLAALKQYYPYSFITSQANPYDMAVFSRVPIQQKETWGGMELRNVAIRVHGATPQHNIPFQVYAVHVASPVSIKSWKRRNRALKFHSWQLRDYEYPNQILVGDFNTTRFSPWFRRMMRVSGLRNAQNGFGLMPTWSFFEEVNLLTGLQIDQMLIDPSIWVEDRHTLSDMGSDHLPVYTKLWLYKR